jgi:hypothetical protein
MTSAGATAPATAAPSAPPDPPALLRSRSHLRLLVLAGEVTYDTEPLEPPPGDRIWSAAAARAPNSHWTSERGHRFTPMR